MHNKIVNGISKHFRGKHFKLYNNAFTNNIPMAQQHIANISMADLLQPCRQTNQNRLCNTDHQQSKYHDSKTSS